jgi:hypothetical protein
MILLLGTNENVRSISRGDSHFVELGGAFVIPLGDPGNPGDAPVWPPTATLEVGGPANLAILDADPRAGPARTRALIREGQVIAGSLEQGSLEQGSLEQGSPEQQAHGPAPVSPPE